jgi:hypothetical protein
MLDMLMLASSSSSPGQRGSIERGIDGGDHRVIGGRAGEMCGNRLQEMIALSDRQRRRRALQQRELLVREREGTRCGLLPRNRSWAVCRRGRARYRAGYAVAWNGSDLQHRAGYGIYRT